MTSKQHPALNLPQSDFIVDALSGFIQVVDELRSESYRKQFASNYERLVTEAYSRFVGETMLTSQRTYGPGLPALWNWFEGLPDWVPCLIGAAQAVQEQRVLSVRDAQSIVQAAAAASPATIAGHLSRVILQELLSDGSKYHGPWPDVVALDRLVSHWSPDHVAWDRVDLLVGQIDGDRQLTVARTAWGWRFITTSTW